MWSTRLQHKVLVASEVNRGRQSWTRELFPNTSLVEQWCSERFSGTAFTFQERIQDRVSMKREVGIAALSWSSLLPPIYTLKQEAARVTSLWADCWTGRLSVSDRSKEPEGQCHSLSPGLSSPHLLTRGPFGRGQVTSISPEGCLYFKMKINPTLQVLTFCSLVSGRIMYKLFTSLFLICSSTPSDLYSQDFIQKCWISWLNIFTVCSPVFCLFVCLLAMQERKNAAIFWNPMSISPLLVNQNPIDLVSNNSILPMGGMVNSNLTLLTNLFFLSCDVLCITEDSGSQPLGKGWPMGKMLEKWRVTERRSQGISTPLSVPRSIACSYCLFSFAPLLLRQFLLLLSQLHGLPSQGCSAYRMPQLLALAKLSSLVIPPAQGK